MIPMRVTFGLALITGNIIVTAHEILLFHSALSEVWIVISETKFVPRHMLRVAWRMSTDIKHQPLLVAIAGVFILPGRKYIKNLPEGAREYNVITIEVSNSLFQRTIYI